MSKHKPYWKGYLRLNLVTIGVSVYNAAESQASIRFKQIHKPTGKRINMERIVQGHGKVESDDVVRGYEVDDNSFILIEEDELASLKLESKKTIDLVQFVDENEIDQRYFERSYYVAPTDTFSAEGFVIVREAMLKDRKVGIGQVTVGGREWLVAVKPLGKGFVMTAMRYASELREPDDYFRDIPDLKPTKAAVDMARQIIKQKAGRFMPKQFKDRYQIALKEMIHNKMKGNRIIVTAAKSTAEPQATKTLDLIESLKRSVGVSHKERVHHVARKAT